ncbi:MAG: hypothetical protein WD269_11790 [Acidimicrobiia bacterium]
MAQRPTGRKARTFGRAVPLALAVVMVISSVAMGAVSTDKDDYAPGSVVTISGDNSNDAGYLADEIVSVEVSGPNGYEASCEAVADESGAWTCQVTLWDDDRALGAYTYAATGQTSGVTESGAFTDANSEIHLFSITPNPVDAGEDLMWSASARCTGPSSGSNSCTNHGSSVNGPVPNGYTINLLQAAGACGTVGQVFAGVDSATTTGGTAGGTVSAPAAAGFYAYRTEHPQQTINSNNWGAVGQGTTPCVTVEVQSGNTPPEADAGGPYSGDEGESISLSGATASDDDVDDSLTYQWSINYNDNMDASGSCDFSDATALKPTITCTDDSNANSFTLTLTVDDGDNDPVSDNATLSVANVAAATSNGALTVNPITGQATASFDFADDGNNDTHTASFEWSIDAEPRSGSVSETNGAGTATDTRTLAPGCHTITVTGTVTDDDDATSSPAEQVATSQQVDVYTVAFKTPIRDNERNFAKYGNVLPVKVEIKSSCTGLPVTSASLFLSYVQGTNGEIVEDTSTVTESVSSADGTNGQMRVADGMHIYNFTTKPLTAGKDYTLRVRLDSQSGPILLQAVLQPKK